MSGLEFSSNHGGGAGAQALADRSGSHGTIGEFGTNTILTVPRSHLEHDVDIKARYSINNEDSMRGKENSEPLLSAKEGVESA
jgi:hypothetical protein